METETSDRLFGTAAGVLFMTLPGRLCAAQNVKRMEHDENHISLPKSGLVCGLDLALISPAGSDDVVGKKSNIIFN